MSHESSVEPASNPPKESPWARIANRVKNLGRPRSYDPPSGQSQEPLMPFDLRFAMQHKEAKLGEKEIGSLINNGYTDLATYAVLKALDHQPNIQKQFLESFVDITLTNDDETKRKELLKNLQRDILEAHIGPEASVKGAKVKQIFLQGVNHWEGKLTDLAQEIAAMEQTTTPVYLGYGAALGLRQGIETFKDSDRKILTFNHNWAEDPSNNNCGYEIDVQGKFGERVRPLPKDFDRPKEYILIDDTRHTGKHIQNAWAFWSNNSGEPLPESRLRILNHVDPNSNL